MSPARTQMRRMWEEWERDAWTDEAKHARADMRHNMWEVDVEHHSDNVLCDTGIDRFREIAWAARESGEDGECVVRRLADLRMLGYVQEEEDYATVELPSTSAKSAYQSAVMRERAQPRTWPVCPQGHQMRIRVSRRVGTHGKAYCAECNHEAYLRRRVEVVGVGC